MPSELVAIHKSISRRLKLKTYCIKNLRHGLQEAHFLPLLYNFKRLNVAQKTYALLDLVGIKDAIKNHKAAAVLERFWNAADSWTTSFQAPVVSIPNTGYRMSPEVYVTTFSDTALLYTDNELHIDDFVGIVLEFKACIERQTGLGSYVIISRNDEIQQPELPALGGNLIGSGGRPRYVKLAGSGTAWINLHAADRAVTGQKAWHGKYSVYAVGEKSLPRSGLYKDSIECERLIDADHIFALE
ncbi:hypothetical protein LSO07_17495 [Janthinobacterium sp. PLB04]|uniref:Uncharacterized protein n=1 Tax=Janthinobacterium lividum TaxID=29581 RepID=A0AAJ4MP46_9BURK|nr:MULTISPECIES: hypothetical protein [Janthinobacterium]QSX94516.1 hypothetical protein J3P46_17480 [Janthinobacterium lividum]UGQ34308.1 hypothetical protein LSO07_17495 [Janthinobacterium sp. PLB04]